MKILAHQAIRIVFLILVLSALASCGADKKKYIGRWVAVNSAFGDNARLIISDNGSGLLVQDPLQPDTFTATIDSSGDLLDSHGRRIPYIHSRNHLLYLSLEYQKVSDSPQ